MVAKTKRLEHAFVLELANRPYLYGIETCIEPVIGKVSKSPWKMNFAGYVLSYIDHYKCIYFNIS